MLIPIVVGIWLVFVIVTDSIDGKFRYAAGNTKAEVEIDSPPVGEPNCTARLAGADVSVGWNGDFPPTSPKMCLTRDLVVLAE
jgi:hypothetical protein